MSLVEFLTNTPKPWANMYFNTISANSVTTPALDTPIVKTNDIQGVGSGTPQTSKIRVATVGDPSQKVGNIWVDNVGTQANKTTNAHVTNLFATNIGSPSNKVSTEFVNQVIADQLSVSSAPVLAYQGVQISGYTLDNFYTESDFSMTLSGGFINDNPSITGKIYGIQRQHSMGLSEFTIYSYEQTGSDDKLYFETPFLKDPSLSGVIPFSTSADPDNWNLAVVTKPAGNTTISFAPIGFRNFQYALYAGQDLYFKSTRLVATDF